MHFSRSDTPQANGSFDIEAPPGKYSLSVSLQDTQDWYADSPVNVEVVAGKESTVEIPLLRAASVRGRVVGAQDGVGVQGAGLAIYHKGPDGSLRYVAAAQTDKDGYYTGYARLGEVSLQVNQTPSGFLAVEGNARAEVTVGQANEPVSVPDIKLSPAASIDIQVVDEQGHPIPDAEIRTVTPHGSGGLSGHQTFRADQDGRVRLEGVDPEDTLPIRVRTKDGTSDGAVVVEPREVKQPVRDCGIRTLRLSAERNRARRQRSSHPQRQSGTAVALQSRQSQEPLFRHGHTLGDIPTRMSKGNSILDRSGRAIGIN